MKRCSLTLCLALFGWISASGQTPEIVDRQDSYQVAISETVKIPLKIRNTTDKPQFYIIRVVAELGTSQKGYFCLGDDCLEPGMTEVSKRIEPGETLKLLTYTLETGLITGSSTLHFEVFPKGSFGHGVEHDINVTIEEKRARELVFQSRDITINDVYPNPVSDQAFIDYRLHNEAVKAKVVIHNVLGRNMSETGLPFYETRIKLDADNLTTGVYFYTVYLDNDGVLTRKLIVRK